MITNNETLIAARAEALFTSSVPTDAHPSRAEVEDAIRVAVRAHHGVRGCAGAVAAAYGDYPELAAPRMRWARQVVASTYARRSP